MIRALRVQVASVLVGLITLVLIAEGVWAVSLVKHRHHPKPAPQITVPARLAAAIPVPPKVSAPSPDVLDFANPVDYTVLTPELELTDIVSVAPAAG